MNLWIFGQRIFWRKAPYQGLASGLDCSAVICIQFTTYCWKWCKNRLAWSQGRSSRKFWGRSPAERSALKTVIFFFTINSGNFLSRTQITGYCQEERQKALLMILTLLAYVWNILFAHLLLNQSIATWVYNSYKGSKSFFENRLHTKDIFPFAARGYNSYKTVFAKDIIPFDTQGYNPHGGHKFFFKYWTSGCCSLFCRTDSLYWKEDLEASQKIRPDIYC